MAKRINQDAKATRPLWIIAVSLLTIAVCLVLLVVKRRYFAPSDDSSGVTVAVQERTAEPTYAARERPPQFRPTPSSQTTTELNETLAISESTARSVLSLGSHTPPLSSGGVLAAVARLHGTNLTTAIVGSVTLRGTPPPELPIDMSEFPPCANLYSNPPTKRTFQVGQNGGLADVFVSIAKGLNHKPYKAPAFKHEIVFNNCQIQPQVSAVMIGQWVEFKNADSHGHKLQLAEADLSPFLTCPLKPESDFVAPEKWLQREKLLKIRCEVHSWETARLFIVGHPFFAVTDTNGYFALPNVPPGEYMLQAMHLTSQNTNTATREATVHPDKISQMHFTLDASGD